jgi:hypothetical protein
VRSSAGVLLRHPIGRVINFIVLAFAFGCSSAPAQQQDSPPNMIALLARAACEGGARLEGTIDLDTGYIAMLGVGEKAYSFRVINNGPHALMIPANQCGDLRLPGNKPFIFILSHSFHNQYRVREGYHYLMNQRGELVNAVHFQDGRSHLFAFANPEIPVRRADFEAEKETWISKVAELAALRKTTRDGD